MSNIIEITEYSAVELDMYARLNEAQLLHYYEPELGLFITESPLVIGRALDAGYEPVSLLLEKKHVDTQAKDIIDRCGDIPVYAAELSVLTQMTGFQLTRGALCAMKRKELPSVKEILKDAKRVAVLESVMNPTNIGAIFRSAAALNMDAVLLTKGCSDPLYRRASRVAMGTVFQIPWTFTIDANEVKKYGFKTAALALRENTLSIRDPRLTHEPKLALILGAEGDGLRDATLDGCDYTVKIPMSHGVDSLNVAAASAVAFFQIAGE